MSFSKFLYCSCTVILLAAVGCGGMPATVSGLVTLDGEPVDHGVVGFNPKSGGMKAVGIIQSDGSYAVKTNRDEGLNLGQYAVTVVVREPGIQDKYGGPPRPGKFIVPQKYSRTRSSGLEFDVTSGQNTINLELSSESSKPRRKRRSR